MSHVYPPSSKTSQEKLWHESHSGGDEDGDAEYGDEEDADDEHEEDEYHVHAEYEQY